MKLSEWQDGVPPSEGIWEIAVPEHDTLTEEAYYYCRFNGGKWGVGNQNLKSVKDNSYFEPYPTNNNPYHPRKWRGQLDD